MFPTKETMVINEFASSYYHFNDRLSQRYGVEITLDEYTELCRVPVIRLEPQTQNKKVGIVKIKGIDVLVVKEIKRQRRLITALPQNRKLKTQKV